MKPTSFDLNLKVSDHGPVAVPWMARARQKNTVVGCRSASAVQLVLPPEPSATPVFPTCASKPVMADVVAAVNDVVSEIWNS